MTYTLSNLQHGKAECRLVKVDRLDNRHIVHDLNVTTQLRGDFTAAYTIGDNSHVHATDTQKNTVYALARKHGIESPEGFLLTLTEHWRAQPWVTGTTFRAEQFIWNRVPQNGHSFVRAGQEVRIALVETDGDETSVSAGLTGLEVLKTTGSEFYGFPRDRYTTLADTHDRVLATGVSATWRYGKPPVEWNTAYDAVRAAMLAAFADTHSLALQQSIYAMGSAALDAVPTIARIHVECPNKHHLLVDLAQFGQNNPGEVFLAADRPYGLISATVSRR